MGGGALEQNLSQVDEEGAARRAFESKGEVNCEKETTRPPAGKGRERGLRGKNI